MTPLEKLTRFYQRGMMPGTRLWEDAARSTMPGTVASTLHALVAEDAEAFIACFNSGLDALSDRSEFSAVLDEMLRWCRAKKGS